MRGFSSQAPAPGLSLGADCSSSSAAAWVQWEPFHAMCPSFGKQTELGSNLDSPAADPVVAVFNCGTFLILDFFF